MDTNNDTNNVLEGGSAADHQDNTLRHTDKKSNDEQVTLPPEVWASVMQFLPFETILSCGATSKMILHEAMPLLTTLTIDKSSQLNLHVAYRFRDIKTMHINSLLKMTVDEDFRDIYLDFESKIRIVPFLSRFASLERVFFGVKDEDGDIIEGFPLASEGYFYAGDESYPDDGSREEMLQLLDIYLVHMAAVHCQRI